MRLFAAQANETSINSFVKIFDKRRELLLWVWKISNRIILK